HHVDAAHDEAAHDAAEETRDRPEDKPDREPDRDRDDADDEREPRAVEDARELVAAELVDAEPVLGGRPRAAAVPYEVEMLVEGPVRREQRREHGHEDEREHEEETDPGAGIAPDPPEGLAPEAARRLERELRALELGNTHE